MRFFIQVFFFAFIAIISVNKTLAEYGRGFPFFSEASLHALCPFGGVVTLYNLATLGTFIKKIHASSVILMSIIFLLAILFGSVFCGWVCPLGTMQEWVGKLGSKLSAKKYNHFVPIKADKVLRYIRYIVLGWVIFVTARSGTLLFSNIDPYNALFTFWSEEVSVPALIILATTLILALFVERPWCKYACPYGALLGLTNKFRIFKIRRAAGTCINCGKCTGSCPMNIQIDQKEKITDLQCISCLECTSEKSCPIENTLFMGTSVINKTSSPHSQKKEPERGGAVMKIRTFTMGIIILAFIFGGISAALAADLWTTLSDKVPAKITRGDFAGNYNPADIRGSYTFNEVATLFEIELKVLYQAFSIPEETDGDEIQTKDLETLYEGIGVEVGNESVQVFVALYKNLPIDLDETYLPETAALLIQEKNKELTEEQKNHLDIYSVDLASMRPIETNGSAESEPPINGSATFQQALDEGITTEQIESIINASMPPSNQPIKDYCIENGLSFSAIKEQLNALIE